MGVVGSAIGSIGSALGGAASSLFGAGKDAIGGIGSVLGDAGSFLASQFDPSQRVVSGVPAELQAALQAAGINIEELIAAGGGLPQFGGTTGTASNLDQQTASVGLRDQLSSNRTGPDLTDFNSILRQLGETGTGDLAQTNAIIEQLRNSGADLSTSDNIISQLRSLEGPDLSSAEGIIAALQNISPDTSAATGAAARLEGLEGPDTGRAAGLLDRVEGLATGSDQRRLIETLLPTLEQATAANRFDLTDTFREGETLFRQDLDEQLADIRAESSALGLGAGSSDRNKRLLETAGRELSRFRLGQENLSREAFESAEGRRIGAINAGSAVSGAVSRPSETLASIVPAALEEGSRGADFAQRGLSATLPTLLQAGLDPAQIRAGALSNALPGALQAGESGANFELNRLLGALDPSIRASLGLGGLEQAGQAAALPTAFQSGIQSDQALSARLLAMLNPSLQAGQIPAQFDLAQRGQQSADLANLFGFGTTERNFGESEIGRLMAEFARTQTGGFDILSKLLGATPASTTAFGPSTVSQLGDLATGAAGVIGAAGGGGGGGERPPIDEGFGNFGDAFPGDSNTLTAGGIGGIGDFGEIRPRNKITEDFPSFVSSQF